MAQTAPAKRPSRALPAVLPSAPRTPSASSPSRAPPDTAFARAYQGCDARTPRLIPAACAGAQRVRRAGHGVRRRVRGALVPRGARSVAPGRGRCRRSGPRRAGWEVLVACPLAGERYHLHGANAPAKRPSSRSSSLATIHAPRPRARPPPLRRPAGRGATFARAHRRRDSRASRRVPTARARAQRVGRAGMRFGGAFVARRVGVGVEREGEVTAHEVERRVQRCWEVLGPRAWLVPPADRRKQYGDVYALAHHPQLCLYALPKLADLPAGQERMFLPMCVLVGRHAARRGVERDGRGVGAGV
ncbi:hypothetical protein C8J57DRAFT_248802 [Mycena rebaudengoi]|nr:hypothetical protein C8J57DRAFT_248802 [Mycena rebaudengoi]